MLFNSMSFYAIFVVFLMIYAVLYKTSRTLMMLYVVMFSLYFFANMNPGIAMLLPVTALLSWSMVKRMNACQGTLRKRWLSFIVVMDLAPLLYFKYATFGLNVLQSLLQNNFPLPDVVLPVGISFYTFQAISHAVDVYRGKLRTEMDFLEYIFYLSFFPLLLAGPINRAGDMLKQMREHAAVDARLLYTGLWLVMMGVIKKCVVADYVAQFNNWAFEEPALYNGVELLMATVGFSVQIYCDFSGYSDMSIGISAMMGYRLRENFNLPYQSLNISEFWRRWHISLSTWFRDYVYIPLGGNRVGALRLYFNNFLTMVIAGLWHGSTMMFALWGALHGVALVVHKMCRKLFLYRFTAHTWWMVILSWTITQCFLLMTWIFFRSPDLDTAMIFLERIFMNFDMGCIPVFLSQRPLWVCIVVGAMLIHGIRERWFYKLQECFILLPCWCKILLIMIVIQMAIEFSNNEVQPFLYYKF